MPHGGGPSDTRTRPENSKAISYSVLPDNTLAGCPRRDPGDIFFDFEGDPLWQDPATGKWGLEYLFGVIENPAGTRGGACVQAVLGSLTVRRRGRRLWTSWTTWRTARRTYPGMHIYHYAAYEKTALRNLSFTHVVGETAVDELLRDGCPGGPLRDRPAQYPDLRELLQHQETRAAVHGAATSAPGT